MNHATAARANNPRTPPTTPPAIAPTFVEDPSLLGTEVWADSVVEVVPVDNEDSIEEAWSLNVVD
ncbi:hypothetical protein HJFPF1_09293 [Paramyrothecium foliicola]|nr:hypothetical protein HJFPF1_09293 [Paramyrothecium foliicola]